MSVSLGFSFFVLQIVSQSHLSQFHLTLYSRHDRSLDLDVLFKGWLRATCIQFSLLLGQISSLILIVSLVCDRTIWSLRPMQATCCRQSAMDYDRALHYKFLNKKKKLQKHLLNRNLTRQIEETTLQVGIPLRQNYNWSITTKQKKKMQNGTSKYSHKEESTLQTSLSNSWLQQAKHRQTINMQHFY